MLQKLIELQQREHLTDGQMARKLGIHRSQWNHVRHGRRQLGHEVAVHAAASWPELTRELLDLVASVADSDKKAA